MLTVEKATDLSRALEIVHTNVHNEIENEEKFSVAHFRKKSKKV